MSETLKLTFDTEDSTRTFSITNPKADVSQDDCKNAMDKMKDSGAFEDLKNPVKAVLYKSESEVIYEA